MTATEAIKATCLCGSAKHEIALQASDLPLTAYICHCDSCRHQTGTLCYGAALLPSHYVPTESLLAKLQMYDFSERIRQYFCPHCGTLMFTRKMQDSEAEVSWFAASGSLDKVEGLLDWRSHGFISDTVDGGFSNFLPTVGEKKLDRWPAERDHGQQLPLDWQAERPSHLANDRLEAHCMCGGVKFWISRPSERSAQCMAAWPDLIVPFHSPETKPSEDSAWWLQDDGKKYLAGLCACNSCRLASGTDFVEWAFVPTVNISLDADGKVPFSREFGTLKHYRSSDVATRHFCGTCGAMVFWDGDERPELIDVAVGLLDAPEGARAEDWLEWRTQRLSYREDGVLRAESLVLGVEAGLKEYGKKHGNAK